MPRNRPTFLQWGLILLLILLVVAIWMRPDKDSSGPETDRSARHFEEAGIDSIEFWSRNRSVVVQREGEEYWIVSPYRDRADDRFIAQSLRVASTLQPLRQLPDTNRAPYGLRPPSAVWRCSWGEGSFAIALGDTVPTGGGRFARIDGVDAILTIDPFLARRYLAPPTKEIHAPIAAPFDFGQIDSVRIETREERLTIARTADSRWRIVAPLDVEANPEAVHRALRVLRRESMTGFLGPLDACDLASLGLAPARAVWILMQGDQTQTVRIGHPTRDERSVHIIPAGREVVGLIGSESFRIWVDGLQRLRETLLVTSSADSIEEIRLRNSFLEKRFARIPRGSWQPLGADSTRPFDPSGFERSVENLSALRATRFVPASMPFDPELTLRLVSARGAVETIELAVGQNNTTLVHGERQPGICEASPDLIEVWRRWLLGSGRP